MYLLNIQGGFWPAEVKFQSSPVQLIEVGSTLRLSFDWYKTLQGNNKPDILKSVQVLVYSVVHLFFCKGPSR